MPFTNNIPTQGKPRWVSISIIFLVCLLAIVIGCSNITPKSSVKDDQPISIITGKPGGIKLSSFLGGNRLDPSLPINAIAWRAALDISSLLPLSDVDTFGGTIVTDWYSLPTRVDERIKLTIFIIGRELRSDSVSVRVHVQKRSADRWSETARDEAFARQIEDLILSRARELRAESITETTYSRRHNKEEYH